MAAKTLGGGFLVNIGDAASAKEIMRIFFLGFSVLRSDRDVSDIS